MKKTIMFAMLFGLVSTGAYAGVSDISSNGNVSGSPSYRVSCSSGSSYIIYNKGGTWYRGDIGHMGNKYDGWSSSDVASYLCN